jgi:hypothetical protein
MGKLTTSHRSTIYPCCIPALGRFTGAGRIGLTRRKDNKRLEREKISLEFYLKRSRDFITDA